MDPNMQTCSLCGRAVADLASHIVDDHTELQDMERWAEVILECFFFSFIKIKNQC